MFDEVSCVIPGASRVEQVASNVAAGQLTPLTPQELSTIDAIYEQRIKQQVHHLW
jgi:aryl-alcohol dehydrogenase-like predicted oxidoreductase